MPQQGHKIDPDELEEARAALEMIRDNLDMINTFLKNNVSRGEYERLKAYGLANAYLGLFEEHEWVARGEDSVEAALTAKMRTRKTKKRAKTSDVSLHHSDRSSRCW